MGASDSGGPLQGLQRPAGSRTYAVAYVTALFLLPLLALAVATWLGWVQFDLTAEATVNIGWILEYAVAAFFALFFLYTAAQVVKAIGVGFTKSVVSAIARVAHNYELPGEVQAPAEMEGSGGQDNE